MRKGALAAGYVKMNDGSCVLVGQFILKYGNNGLWYGTFTHFDKLSIKHGVSSRLGGTSKEPFASLNLGLHTGDQDEDVVANRRLFCKAIGIDLEDVVTAEQLHTDKVVVVTAKDIGKGAKQYSEAIPAVDALVTNAAGIPLLLCFADCVPVLIVDPVCHAIGVVHAGWKGTVEKIAQKAIIAMKDNFGTNPQDCLVGIAPSIGPCCYIVNEIVVEELKKQFENWEQLVRPHGDKWYFDLWKANSMQLEQIGVLRSNIAVSGVCTACNNDLFFSYREDNGRTGRMGALIML